VPRARPARHQRAPLDPRGRAPAALCASAQVAGHHIARSATTGMSDVMSWTQPRRPGCAGSLR